MKNFLKATTGLAVAATLGFAASPALAGDYGDKNKEAMTDASIVDVAMSKDDFSTLVSAVKAANLVETLDGETEFTVFAPTNAAFEKVDSATLTSLLEPENQGQLTDILTYHVVAGEVKAADLIAAIEASDEGYYKFETVNGDMLKAKMWDGAVYIKDSNGNKAKVTATDIDADNGVIHVIDTVVMPAPAS